MTLQHCVHNGGGSSRAAFARGLTFSAAISDASVDVRPFGAVPATYVTIYSSWMTLPKGANGAAASNMAVVSLQKPIGYKVGWVPVASPGVSADTTSGVIHCCLLMTHLQDRLYTSAQIRLQNQPVWSPGQDLLKYL
jgi:hypothetical protein